MRKIIKEKNINEPTLRRYKYVKLYNINSIAIIVYICIIISIRQIAKENHINFILIFEKFVFINLYNISFISYYFHILN